MSERRAAWPHRRGNLLRRALPALLPLLWAAATCGNEPGVGADADISATDVDAEFDTGGIDAVADAVPPDTDTQTDGGADLAPDADVGCADDIFGPRTDETAIPVDEDAEFVGLAACAGAEEWFVVRAPSGTAVGVTVTPAATPSSLRAAWIFENGASEDATIDRSGVARLDLASSGDAVWVRIANESETDEVYGVRFELVVSDTCLATPEEPNDSGDAAFVVESPWELETRICEDDEDWYRFAVPIGGTLTVELGFTHADGDIDVELFAAEDLERPVAVSNSAADEERIQIGPQAVAAEYLLRVYGWEGATNRYAIRSTIFVEEGGFPANVTGTVAYEDRRFDHEGFTGELDVRLLGGGLVEVIRERDGATVGTTTTGTDGAFAAVFLAHDEQRYRVRAISAGEFDGFRVEVRDRSGAPALYGVEGEPFAADEAPAEVALLARASEPTGGAFNVVDISGLGFRFIAAHTDQRSPTLTYYWQDGLSYSCGSCYSDSAIRLGGQVEDPDQYDDDIILHEFGHYFVHHFSADASSGGTHRDRQVDPWLAYGEGVAYFWSSMVRADATMVDNYLGDYRFIDYEAVTQQGVARDDFVGTTDGTLSGRLREEIVAGILWDIYDGASDAEPFDRVAIGAEGSMRILLDYFGGDGIPVDVGLRNVELTDYLNAVTCWYEDVAVDLQAVVDDREYPYDVEDGANCDFKGAGLPDVSIEVVDGVATLVGKVSSTVYDVHVETALALGKRQVRCASSPCVAARGVGSGHRIVAVAEGPDGVSAASWVGADAARRLHGGGRVAFGAFGRVRTYR